MVGQYPDNNWYTNFSLLANGKNYGLFNVKDIENLIGYDFFANIPTKVLEKMAERSIKGTIEKLNAIKPIIEPFPLLADGFPLSEIGSALDSAIGHDSIPDYIHGSTYSVVGNGSISEISTNENVMLTTIQKSSFTENSTDGTSLIQVTSNQISTSQTTPKQINTFQISIPDNGIIQPCFYQGSTKEIGSSQISFTQTSETQIGSTEINISQDGTSEVNPVSPTVFVSNYNSSSKVSLTGSVPFQQLFSGNFPNHDLTHIPHPQFTNINIKVSFLYKILCNT